jgi:succinate-semialdehyde dehydrogenase/glutarate-semialdehyde dehydrogenase
MSKLVSINPTDYKEIGSIAITTKKEVLLKLKKAHTAKKQWRAIGLDSRISLLRKVVDELIKNKQDLAQLATKEMGMPISQTKADIEDAVHYFTWYLDNASKYLTPEVVFQDENAIHTVYLEPLGVAAVITPWNFPLSNFVWGAAQNLIVGNVVIYKTSEECPLFGKLLEEIIESANLPEGVFTEIYGDGKIADFLVHQDIDFISFTGSTKIGKYLYKLAGAKFIKAVMELGGSAPAIVFPDADIDISIENIYGNRFTNCGQMCDALKRLIVHESIFDDVITKLKNKLNSVKVGDPLDSSTDIGPLVAKRQLELLEEQVKDAIDKGAKVVIGGKRLSNLNGAFYEPTILTNITPNMRVWKEEVFGPVLPVVAFDTKEDAIKKANDTQYGLGSYIYTKDKNKALEIASQIDTGMVSINSTSYIHPCSPFGGYKNSGIGREHGKYGFAELTQIKLIAIDK